MRVTLVLFYLASIFLLSNPVLASGVQSGFDKREQYKERTKLGNPDEAGKFLDRNKDVSALGGLNDSGLISKGSEEMRNSSDGRILQNAEEKKIMAIERYKINSGNAMLKKSLELEENPMAKTGGKGLGFTERTLEAPHKKSCLDGVDFNVDVGLELVLEAEEIREEAEFNITGSSISYQASPQQGYTSYEFSSLGNFAAASRIGGGVVKNNIATKGLNAIGLGKQKGSDTTINASELNFYFSFTTNAPIDEVSLIELVNINYRSVLGITVNGNMVIVAPMGGNRLVLAGYHTETEKGKRKYGGVAGKKVKHTTNYPIIDTGTGRHILGKGEIPDVSEFGRIDLLPYIREGENVVEIKVIGIEQASVDFTLNAKGSVPRFIEKGEYWQVVTEGTEQLAEANECYQTERVCIKSGVKKFFNRYDVSRPCWYEKITYRCESEPKNGCAHLDRQGCRLQGSICEHKVGGICLKWKREYLCGGQNKELHYSLADSSIYCLGGDCHKPVIEQNNDFANVAYLAAVNEAHKDCVKGSNGICKDPITVFPGEAQSCRKMIVSFVDCCSSMKGWGQSANMCRCGGEEKGLAMKREKGLCHPIGSYCAEKDPVFGKCLVKKTGFCCFGSKLARIFHEQGRQQLGIGWGSPASPNCQPLTLEQLTRLDFSKFDMEELFEALLDKGKSKMNKSWPSVIAGKIPEEQKEHMKTTPLEKREIRRRALEEEERKRLAKLEEERKEKEWLERERLARLEAERLERERLARIEEERRKAEWARAEQARLAQLEAENKNRRRVLREQQIRDGNARLNAIMNEYNIAVAPFRSGGGYMVPGNHPSAANIHRLSKAHWDLKCQVNRWESQLRNGDF